MASISETKTAEHVIRLRDDSLAEQFNFRSLWQDTADWILPMFGRITSVRTPGERLGVHLSDVTARTEARNMASGLSAQIIPPDSTFFELQGDDRDNRDDGEIEEYMGELSEDTHSILFDSNFKEEFDGSLQSHLVFGNACLFPKWSVKRGLTHRSYPIGSYQLRQDEDGIIDTLILTVKRTARQLHQQFGNKIGPQVRKALEDEALGRESNDLFDIIQIVRPRTDRDVRSISNLNMPVQSLYIGELDRNILEESGFPEFPFSTPRWWKSPGELYGRGQGTEILPQVLKLNQMELDHADSGNMWVRPPLEILESYDGSVMMMPAALHHVVERQTITAVDLGARGAYPVSKDALEAQRDIVKEAFLKNALEQISSLTGDRRTTVEIFARLKEGFKKLSQPIGRVFTELLNPDIQRVVKLLIRNGVVRQPPPQLRRVKIKYTGPLALALQDQQVEAFDLWLDMVTRMEEVQLGTVDNIDFDQASRDVGRSMGVKESHVRPIADRDQMRQARQAAQEQQQALAAAQTLAQGYGQTTKAPEPGSAAEQLQGAV
jgi:hypothetical protein